jgi:hypothetical protein
LCALGDKVSEKEEIKKLLHSVPDHLEQVTISIETLLDRNMMTATHAWLKKGRRRTPVGQRKGVCSSLKRSG